MPNESEHIAFLEKVQECPRRASAKPQENCFYIWREHSCDFAHLETMLLEAAAVNFLRKRLECES
jgi:hypothetical protein